MLNAIERIETRCARVVRRNTLLLAELSAGYLSTQPISAQPSMTSPTLARAEAAECSGSMTSVGPPLCA
jgi:hypothetical protein